MMQIDKTSRIPSYVQLMNFLVKQIEDGELKEDEQLPSERELCNLYGVSRSTVRQAIQELEKDRYLEVLHGKGTFVSPRHLSQEMSSFYSFTEEMKKLGKTISTKLLDFCEMPCDEKISRKFQCKVGETVYRFTRIRYADDEPMMIVTTFLPKIRFPKLDQERLKSESLYSMLSDTYHVIFTKAKETLQSVIVRKGEAELLQISETASCMKIQRFTYEKQVVIEYAVGIVRGDKFQYNVELD